MVNHKRNRVKVIVPHLMGFDLSYVPHRAITRFTAQRVPLREQERSSSAGL